MRSFSKPLCYLFRRNKYFFIGCLIGVILSSFLMPMWDDCENHPKFITPDDPEIDPSSLAVLKLNLQEYQLFLSIEKWYREMSSSDYNPIIRNKSSKSISSSSLLSQEQKTGQNELPLKSEAMVRDKKLKFYRPRFHSIELNVKMKLLICILIRPRFLFDSFDHLNVDGITKSDFYSGLISQFINQTSDMVLEEFKDDLIYFYADTSTANIDNLEDQQSKMAIANSQGKTLDIYPQQTLPQQPFHVKMLNYLIERKKIQEYSLVLMITEQTLINVLNLEQILQRLSVSDLVLSTSDGQIDPSNSEDGDIMTRQMTYFRDNLGKNDSILNYGLLISSTLILLCHGDWSCYTAKTIEFKQNGKNQDGKNQDHATATNGNIDYWHKSLQINETKLISKLKHNETVDEEDRILESSFLYPVQYGSKTFELIQTIIIVDSIRKLTAEIDQVEAKIRTIQDDDDQPILFPGAFSAKKPRNRYEVPLWTYSNDTHVFMPNELQVIRAKTAEELKETHLIKKECLDRIRSQIQSELLDQEEITVNDVKIENLYRKFDAVRGMEYIVDLQLAPASTKHRFHILKPLNPVELLTDVPRTSGNIRLTIILPVRGHREIPLAISFLNRYADVCWKNPDHQTIVIAVLIRTRSTRNNSVESSSFDFESKEFDRLKNVSIYLQSKFFKNSEKIVFMDMNSTLGDRVDLRRKFPSEMVYLDLISRSLAATSDEPLLMLHCRSNMIFSNDFLNRIRVNTIASNQIFVPIPFVEYRLRTSLSNNDFSRILDMKSSKSTATAEQERSLFWSISQLTNVAGTGDGDKFKTGYTFWDVHKNNGYFDETNREFISFYLHDYLKARKQTEDLIPIVRNRQFLAKHQNLYYDSSIDLLEMFEIFNRKQTSHQNRIVLMKAVEPDLKLYHTTILNDCDHFESDQFSRDTCQHRLIYGLGPKQKLAAIIFEYMQKKSPLWETL